MPDTASDKTVQHIVCELLERGGHSPSLGDGSNLLSAGLCSEDGVELACDLEARLGIEVPHDFNPLIHESGRRMRTLGELKAWAGSQARTSVSKEQ